MFSSCRMRVNWKIAGIPYFRGGAAEMSAVCRENVRKICKSDTQGSPPAEGLRHCCRRNTDNFRDALALEGHFECRHPGVLLKGVNVGEDAVNKEVLPRPLGVTTLRVGVGFTACPARALEEQ